MASGFYQLTDHPFPIESNNYWTETGSVEETHRAEESEDEDSIPVFDDTLYIDGRTYKVSPNFSIPAGIDINSPVKINFDEKKNKKVEELWKTF